MAFLNFGSDGAYTVNSTASLSDFQKLASGTITTTGAGLLSGMAGYYNYPNYQNQLANIANQYAMNQMQQQAYQPISYTPPPPKHEIKAGKCICCMRSAVVCRAQKSGYLPKDSEPASWLHRLRMEILEWHDDVLGRLATA